MKSANEFVEINVIGDVDYESKVGTDSDGFPIYMSLPGCESFINLHSKPYKIGVNVGHIVAMRKRNYPTVKISAVRSPTRWYHRWFRINPEMNYSLVKSGSVDVIVVALSTQKEFFAEATKELKALAEGLQA